MQLTAFVSGAIFLATGCGTDYRTHSVINTEKPAAMAWEQSPPFLSGRTFSDPHLKYRLINPYTYNPADPLAYKPVPIKPDGRGRDGSKPTGYVYSPNNKSSWNSTYFSEWLQSATNMDLMGNSLKSTNNNKYRMFLEVFAPLYWKASESTNITGLTDADRKYYRDELQNALLQTIKESTEQHLSELKSTENNGNLLLGAATIGLAGGASVASSATAKALAAAASGTAGARSLFNDQVYRNTFVESTIALIEDDQAKFLASLRTNQQTQSIHEYTVEAAIMDAKEYEARGSFYHGLALLQQAVQNKINGGTNLVTINQYMPEINSPQTITLSVSAIDMEEPITGQGLSQVDTGALMNSSNKVIKVTSVYGSSDNKLTVKLTGINTNTPGMDVLRLPLYNNRGYLTIPVTTTNK